MRLSGRTQSVLRLFAIAVAAGLIVAVPAGSASARPGAGVPLSVLPLPASSLGPEARSLRLERNSGVITNRSLYWSVGSPLYPNRLAYAEWRYPAKFGRVSGYALDYGHGDSGRRGINEVWTGVDEYTTSADATTGLAWWRRQEAHGLAPPAAGVLSATTTREKAPAVGNRRFSFLIAYRAQNIAPLFGLDEQFTVGKYEADVTIWAGSAGAAKKLAPRLAKKLDARIERALAGQLHARPVKLPRPAGQFPGTPDLAPLALQTTDLSGRMVDRGYGLNPRFPFAVYSVEMDGPPGGEFQSLSQDIIWFATANEARFEEDWEDHSVSGLLDLSSLGDGAWGYIYSSSVDSPAEGAVLYFSSGRLFEAVDFYGDNAIQASQAESVAQIVANRINTAGFGK